MLGSWLEKRFSFKILPWCFCLSGEGGKTNSSLSPVFCFFSFRVLQGLRWMLTAGVGPDGKGSGIAIL